MFFTEIMQVPGKAWNFVLVLGDLANGASNVCGGEVPLFVALRDGTSQQHCTVQIVLARTHGGRMVNIPDRGLGILKRGLDRWANMLSPDRQRSTVNGLPCCFQTEQMCVVRQTLGQIS